MGKRGPAPTPTNLTVLRGNPGKRPINKREPKPPSDRVRCPARLKGEARKIWQQTVPQLKRLGLLTNIDVNEFAKYCEIEALYRKAVDFLMTKGTYYVVYGVDGQQRMRKVPQSDDAFRFGRQASAMARDFGLTPSARTGIEVKPIDFDAVNNDKSRFFNR